VGVEGANIFVYANAVAHTSRSSLRGRWTTRLVILRGAIITATFALPDDAVVDQQIAGR
jgi:isoprenylcysteine carboxyl methyltransferase (ICMT) family protein YpbQ